MDNTIIIVQAMILDNSCLSVKFIISLYNNMNDIL